MTIEQIVKTFSLKENKTNAERIYKLIILNDCNVTPFKGTTFWLYDPFVEVNTGIHWLKNGKCFKYDVDESEKFMLNIRIPRNWKQIVVDYVNGEYD